MCDRDGCDREGTLNPVLLMWPINYFGLPAKAIISLKVCDHCALTATAEDYICDEGWMQIAQGFRMTGKAIPARERTKVEFIPIK